MKVVKYHADGDYYKPHCFSTRLCTPQQPGIYNFDQKQLYESAPFPHKNSTIVLDTIAQAKNTPKERFDYYLPSNNATRKIIESHVYVE
jgi:hypothetical protein